MGTQMGTREYPTIILKGISETKSSPAKKPCISWYSESKDDIHALTCNLSSNSGCKNAHCFAKCLYL